MRAREARAAAALIDAVAAPEPPLPPVERTDAVASFAAGSRSRPSPTAPCCAPRCSRSPPRASRSATAPADSRCCAGSAAPRSARACAPPRRSATTATPASCGPWAMRADVCVIGSGAGGAVAAAELAEGGLRVVLLEEGPARGVADATGRPRDTLPRLYRDGGQVATIGRPPLMLPLGRGTGGTTFVNSGTCFRTPPPVLERWRTEHGIDGLTDALFERVETALGVAEVTPELAGRNAATIRRGAERLGWSGGYLRRNARGCRGSGVCAFGCPTGAKQHAGEVYLPRALEAGAELVTGARAERILVEDGRARGVRRGPPAARSRCARRHGRRRRRRGPHAAAARPQRARPLPRAGPQPDRAPRDRGLGRLRRPRRHEPRRPAVLLRRRVRRPRLRVRGDRRPAGLPRARGAVQGRRAARADARPPPRRPVRADGHRPLAREGRERARAARRPLRPRRRGRRARSTRACCA